MNQSVVNFYTYLTQQEDVDPAEVETEPDGPAHLKVGTTRYLVEKLYGDSIILHSDSPGVFIEDGGANDRLVIMPEDPDSETIPISNIPLDEVEDGSGPIPREAVKEHSPSEAPKFWSSGVGITHAHKDDLVEVALDEELSEKVTRVAEDDPAYADPEQVVKAACRMLAEEHETYGEAT